MNIKRFLVLIGIGLCIGIGWTQYQDVHAKELQTDIAEKIIRFHIIADNDSEEAQNLKLRMKEKTLSFLKTFLDGSETKAETEVILKEHLSDITAYITQEIQREGYSYEVKTELTTCYFPIKEYGSLTFPAGYYEALEVKIGQAQGKNWWCVMYPNLCFVDGTYAVISNEVKQELSSILTKEEYNELLEGGKTKVKFRFFTFLNKYT